MASRRRVTSLFVVLLSLSSTLLSGDAVPQGYHTRHTRAHKCHSCPRDCSDKLADQVEIEFYTPPQAAQPAQPQYAAAAAAVQPSYTPNPTPTPHVAPQAKPQAQQYSAAAAVQPYQRVTPPVLQLYRPPARPCQQAAAPPVQAYQAIQTPYIPDYNADYNAYPYNESGDNYLDPCGYAASYDCPYGSCRCGRSLDADNDYTGYSQYNGRSLNADKPNDTPVKPLPFADESGPPADFYKNYRPYVKDSDRYGDDSEEESDRDKPGKKRDRLFVVYRADAFDEKPSDSELESVIRQAMDVARQQKNQENFARNARKPYRYHYAPQGRRSNNNERIDFKPLSGQNKAAVEMQRFNLSPGPLGPLLSVGETYVKEEGDDALNPGLDQSKWTAVPSLTDMELKSSPSDAFSEIDAAVSVVPDIPKTKIMKIPKIIQKAVDASVNKDKLKKESIEIVRTQGIEKKDEKVAELIEDMPTPSAVTESTIFDRPAEIMVTSAPTTTVTIP